MFEFVCVLSSFLQCGECEVPEDVCENNCVKSAFHTQKLNLKILKLWVPNVFCNLEVGEFPSLRLKALCFSSSGLGSLLSAYARKRFRKCVTKRKRSEARRCHESRTRTRWTKRNLTSLMISRLADCPGWRLHKTICTQVRD